MKKLALALVAFAISAPSAAAAQDVAPAVKRKPVATSAAPAAPRQAIPASAAPQQSVAPAAPQQSAAPAAPQQGAAPAATPAVRPGNERQIHAALTAAAGQGGEAALDTSLIRVMTRLAAAGRCSEAASLAQRDGRNELASRARQLCK